MSIENNSQDIFSWTAFCLTFLIAGLTYFIYNKIIKPYKQYCNYRSTICSEYKVYAESFNPFFPHEIMRLKNDFQKHGDSHHTTKYELRNYQLVLSVLRSNISLNLIDTELIRQFYEKASQGYYKKSMDSIFTSAFTGFVGGGLLFSEGHEWRIKRKIMAAVFNHDFIRSKVATISKITNQLLDKVEDELQNRGHKQVKMDIDNIFLEIFGSVVIKCFFGNIKLEDLNGENIFHFGNRLVSQNFQRAFTLYAYLVGPNFASLNLRPCDRLANRMCGQFNAHVSKIINQHLSNYAIKKVQEDGKQTKSQSSGVIELLIESKKLKTSKEAIQANPEDKDFYTTQDLVDELKTFMFAGNETTTNFTSSLIYQLTKHKEIMERLRQEIKQVLGENEEITYQKLKQMKYLQKCQKQALRMYSPATGTINREATKDHYIGKLFIKAGMQVQVSILANHHKESFAANPQVFNPDRWDAIDLRKKDAYCFFPFSLGQRNCIGQHLAMIESKIVVINLLRRYKEIVPQKQQFGHLLKLTYGTQRMISTFVK